MIEVLFVGSLLLVLYPYLLFPGLLFLRGALLPRPWRRASIEPAVSLIVACHDEEQSVAGRIENALALDYPPDKLQIVIVSDGSTDATAEIARGYTARGVLVLDLPRLGKAGALNAGVAAATGEVLVFSDANSRFDPDALRMLVRNLADPAVGGVAGDQRYHGARRGTAAGERGYWSYDRLLKRAESRAGNVISATGSIYCLRRELFREVPDGVTDDFVTSTRVIAAGRRLVFEPEAVSREEVAVGAGAELARKTRVITRGLYGVWVQRSLLNPLRHGFYALQLASHKLLRRLVVFPLLVLWASSLLLWNAGPLYRAAAVAQTLFYAAAAAGIGVPRYFCLVNLACLAALWNLLRGRRIDRWAPARRAAPEPRALPPCSVIIPTYHRPEALRACLQSLLEQTVLPAELLVIDDGKLPGLPLRAAFEQRGVRCALHHKDRPGLTESRAAGVALACLGEVLVFLDDDVVLQPDFLERLVEPFAADPTLGGASGAATNLPRMTAGRWLRWAAGVLLLNSGFREGRVLPSGFCVNYGATPFPPDRTVEVEFLAGGICAYRREVFDRFRFTAGYRALGFGEDKDFSYQVGRAYRLLHLPSARLLHDEAPQMRPDDRRKGRMFLTGRYLFFRDHVLTARGGWTWACFWYAVAGYLALRSLIWFASQERRHLSRVHGALDAVREILSGRLAPAKRRNRSDQVNADPTIAHREEIQNSSA